MLLYLRNYIIITADDHETDYEYEGSDNEEDQIVEGEPR